MMSTVAACVPFKDLCSLCERICKKAKKDKLDPLRDFIHRWRDFHQKLHKDNSNMTDSFYPALRLLLPHCERERAAYGIKEITLAKLYIKIFCLDKNSDDAQKLLNYRSPKISKSDVGDFATVAYFILKKRCPEKGSLKIHDINHHLDNISTGHATKSKDEINNSLMFLLRNTTALEQKWLIRMILKDMKLGMSENTILKAYHIDGMDLYNVTNSLEKVCVQLKDPTVRLHEIEISLFSPFRPMLGEQVLPTQVEKLMNNQPFFIETKYDGERLQLHKQGNMYKYFSRNAHEVTLEYGENPVEGKLTPHISAAFKPHVINCILDGEILIYSNKMKCIVSKGENADVQLMQPDGEYHCCYCVFDILLVNGKVLTNHPFVERISELKNIINPISGRIQVTSQKEGVTNEDVVAALNSAIDNREEGIVIKNPMSIYRPNVRKGGGWVKLKPDYIDNLMDELDLLIVGGFYGEGRRANKISHFLLGVSDSNDSGKFFTVAKVGSGYSDKELDELLQKLTDHWETFDPKRIPRHLVIAGGRKELPEVWIDPQKSHVVQVRAAEIVRSEKFATNYTLRFPRVQKIRYDKSWQECMTLQEFEDLRKQSEGRLANQYELPADGEPSPKKARKSQPERVITVAPHFRPANIADIQQASEILKDKEICVMASLPQVKQQLEKTIAEHGGKFVQNPGPQTYCVLADKVTLKVNNVISTSQYDVAKDIWLKSCIDKKELLPWIPDYMFYSTPSTEAKLRVKYDEYGDGYYEDATTDSIKKVFQNISRNEWMSKRLDAKEIADIELCYFTSQSKYSMFRLCRVYVDDKLLIGDSTTDTVNYCLKLITSKLRLYGATIISKIDSTTTHVIVHSRDTSRVGELREMSRSRKSGNFHIVTEKWVERCILHGNLLQEKEYMPHSCA